MPTSSLAAATRCTLCPGAAEVDALARLTSGALPSPKPRSLPKLK
jgi:hypothetical protein